MLKSILIAIPLILSAGDYSFNKPSQNVPIELIRKANNGDSESQYIAGALFYQSGKIKESVDLMTKSANQNNNKALFFLAALYLKGEGVPKNIQKSYDLFDKAEKFGNLDAKEFKIKVSEIMRESKK